jgi:hypothetical protein
VYMGRSAEPRPTLKTNMQVKGLGIILRLHRGSNAGGIRDVRRIRGGGTRQRRRLPAALDLGLAMIARGRAAEVSRSDYMEESVPKFGNIRDTSHRRACEVSPPRSNRRSARWGHGRQRP